MFPYTYRELHKSVTIFYALSNIIQKTQEEDESIYSYYYFHRSFILIIQDSFYFTFFFAWRISFNHSSPLSPRLLWHQWHKCQLFCCCPTGIWASSFVQSVFSLMFISVNSIDLSLGSLIIFSVICNLHLNPRNKFVFILVIVYFMFLIFTWFFFYNFTSLIKFFVFICWK